MTTPSDIATKESRGRRETRYAELDVTSNFSFLRGASHAEELVAQAKVLGLAGLAVCDRNTLAGVVRAHVAAKEAGLRFIVGARLDLEDAPSLLCYPKDRKAYGRLSRLISLGQGRAEKGKCILTLADAAAHAEGCIFIALPPEDWNWREVKRAAAGAARPSAQILSLRDRHEQGSRSAVSGSRLSTPPLRAAAPAGMTDTDVSQKVNCHPGRREPAKQEPAEPGPRISLEDMLRRVKSALGGAPLYLAASHTYRGEDRARIGALAQLAKRCGTPLVATGAVLYHAAHRRMLQDVLTCVREHTTIHEAGLRLEANAERHLKRPAEMARLFKGHEDALARSIEIMEACRFSLDELVYEYPDEPVPAGKSAQAHLEDLTWEGAAHRFPDGLPEQVRATLTRELKLIAELNYAPYFLTVHDIVAFARSRGILCQGRGSAANSAVCYCLAITAVNPVEVDLLFERFISESRREPPDIDVDFEHERREDVIQYIYARYGRDRAGLAATVISYRARSAVRDVGKALGLSEDTVAALAGMVWGTRSGGTLPEKHVREAGLDPHDPLLATVLDLAEELMGFPRHLSQHVGGFVLTRGPLIEVVPVGNAAMADRTFIEWDKDDIAALGLLKVDVLALGMLTCIRKAFELLEQHHGLPMTLAKVPREDPAVYDMLCRADSIGVFQVESRAQMNMLPRLKPRCFYDLVIEVAIVRPGPIQGDMVHPYLRRRSGLEAEIYPAPSPEHGPRDELRNILGKTKGVPLFQEQAMRIAMDAAKFTDGEVNELRKAMATFRRRGTIGLLEEKMVSQMVKRGYDPVFAARCFAQIKGFGEYGFPESHAASFAHLVYVSSWLKCHYPAAFACALLNSQPMGFYAPAQIVRDAQTHGVEARQVDVNFSDWDATLEDSPPPPPHHRREGCTSPPPSWGRPGGGDSVMAPLGIPPTPSPSPQGRGAPALRLGLRQIDGLNEADARKIVEARRAPKNAHALSSPLEGKVARSAGGGCSMGEDGIEWQTSAHASCENFQQTRNGSSGNICDASNSADAGFAGSIQLVHSSSTSYVWRENSSLKSMDASASTEKSQLSSGTADEQIGCSHEDIALSESGIGISGCISSMSLKEFSESCSLRNSARISFTPTPALPLQGGGREQAAEVSERGQSRLERTAEAVSSPLEGEVARSAGGGYASLQDLWRRAGVKRATLEKLATADALRSLGLDRRQALWEVRALVPAPALPLFEWSSARDTGEEEEFALPEMALSEHVVNDYQTLRLSLKAHPMSFLREEFSRASPPPLSGRPGGGESQHTPPARPPAPGFHSKAHGSPAPNRNSVLCCEDVRGVKDGARIAVAGVVLVRQRPGSAKGVVFMTIEDETGVANAVVWPKMLEKFRKVVMTSRLIEIRGRVQRHEDIIHIVAENLIDRSGWLLKLSEWANDMKVPLANADEVVRPEPGSARGRAGEENAHPRFARNEPREPRPHHPRNVRIIPKSRDFH